MHKTNYFSPQNFIDTKETTVYKIIESVIQNINKDNVNVQFVYDDLQKYLKEFKLDFFLDEVFEIKEAKFIQDFLNKKGTEDLLYLLTNFYGLNTIINKETQFFTNQFNRNNYLNNECSLNLKTSFNLDEIQVDLWNTNKDQIIKEIINQFLHVCTYLKNVEYYFSLKDSYNKEINDIKSSRIDEIKYDDLYYFDVLNKRSRTTLGGVELSLGQYKLLLNHENVILGQTVLNGVLGNPANLLLGQDYAILPDSSLETITEIQVDGIFKRLGEVNRRLGIDIANNELGQTLEIEDQLNYGSLEADFNSNYDKEISEQNQQTTSHTFNTEIYPFFNRDRNPLGQLYYILGVNNIIMGSDDISLGNHKNLLGQIGNQMALKSDSIYGLLSEINTIEEIDQSFQESYKQEILGYDTTFNLGMFYPELGNNKKINDEFNSMEL